MATCQWPQVLQEGHGENEDMRETDRYGVFAFANHRALILRCAFQNLLLKKLVLSPFDKSGKLGHFGASKFKGSYKMECV